MFCSDARVREPNLKEVEKRTYISYHQDGLIDLFIGFYILLFAAAILLNTILDLSTWFIFPAIFPALIIPIWISIKKRVTIPRIDYVKFKSGGTNKLTAVFLALMVAGLGTFFLFGFASTQSWASTLRNIITSNSMIFIGLRAFVISSLFAYTIGLQRLYAYGIVSLALFTISHFITVPIEYLLVTIGLVILVYGSLLLMQFIRKYPLSQGEKSNAQQPI